MKCDDSFFGAEPGRMDRLVARALDDSDADEPIAATAALDMVLEQPGSQIDRYKLLRVLGEGGMGVVYLAEQTELVQRQVALKIIKPGMDSKQVLARFEGEKQALARMEHPHIARVYDAGLAPSGRPYFVMEHVKGLPLTKHCDEHRLTVEKRLRLYLHVCEAVQHAHQKGIIHRDLKPSNILVTIQDQETIPKVIDFGVARAISQPWTEQTQHTDQGQLIGTPEYMSPEQANQACQDIDTRSDVYSLGVVLYELLAGVLPFDRETFRTGGPDHIRRVICEEDPKTPSSRVRSSCVEGVPPSNRGQDARDTTELARRRQTDVRTLQRQLHGDLDWITLKALEKDRTRRYATVDAFATDIRHYLNHKPVSAAPPAVLYRAGKFARRHRQALAVAGASALLLLVLLWAVQAHVRVNRQSAYAEALEHRQILEEAQRLVDTGNAQAQDASDASDRALAQIAPLLTSRHVGPQAQLLYATILVEHRYYAEATPRLEALLDGPTKIAGAAYALLARTVWEGPSLGPAEVKKAEEYQKKAEELLPPTAEAYYLRAMAALTIHEKLILLAEAVRHDRDHYPSRRLQALTHLASRRYEDLKNDAMIITDRWPADPLGYSLRAIAWRELGHYEDAIADYNEAIARTPKDGTEYRDWSAQRCETFLRMGDYQRVIAEAQTQISPTGGKNSASMPYHAFCALTALGRYEEAGALFRRVVDSERAAGARFRDWNVGTQLKTRAMRYVFDALEAGRPWHPPESKPEGPAFLAMFEAQEMHRSLSAKARRLIPDGFTGRWSPDGTKVAFSMGALGNSGVAIYDLKTRQTDLLVVPGKNPSWSPDGQCIAFARDRSVLRLSEFTGAEPRYQNRPPSDMEVWVMKADGTAPRRLAAASDWPSWSADSRQVYYQVGYNAVRAISIEDTQAKPIEVTPSTSVSYAISPDGRYVAHAELGPTQITEVTSQSKIAEWGQPLPAWPRDWSPDGCEISLGGSGWSARTGLWIYDFDRKEAAKVLSGYVATASWSQDKSQLLIGLSGPYNEIWVASLGPGLSTVEALGGGRTPEEHCREIIDLCTRELAVDPNVMNTHWERVVCALWMRNSQTPFYLQEFGRAIDRVPLHPYFCCNEAWGILYSPSLRDRLGQLASMYARKAAEKDSGYARALAPLCQAAGQPEEAARLWQMGKTTGNFLVNGGFEDGVPRPWRIVGGVDLQVVTELRGAAVPEVPLEGKYCLYVDVTPDTTYYWSASLRAVGAVFEAGKKYTVSAFLKAKKGTLNVGFKPEQNVPGWPAYGEQMFTITDTWAEYHVTTPVFDKDVVPACFSFLLGAAQGGLWIDDVRFYEGDYVPTMVRR